MRPFLLALLLGQMLGCSSPGSPEADVPAGAAPELPAGEVRDGRLDVREAEAPGQEAPGDGAALIDCRVAAEETAPGVEVGFSFDAPPTLPYPFDVFTADAADSPTGLRLSLGTTNTILVDEGLGLFENPQPLLDLLGGLTGFSTYAPVLFSLSGKVDLGQAAADPFSFATWDSPVIMVPLTADGYGAPLPLLVSTRTFEVQGDEVEFLRIAPYQPLASATRYAVFVTARLKAEDGTLRLRSGQASVGPHPHFRYLAGCGGPAPEGMDPDLVARAAAVLAPALSGLGTAAAPVCPCDLAAATVFTTAANDRTITAIYEYLHGDDAPPLNLTLDPDDDGKPDVFPAEELPMLPEEGLDVSTMSVAIRGAFDMPELRGADKDVHLADGKPVPAGTLRIPFVLMLPHAAAAQPFRVVVMGHGHSGTKERIGYLARRFGEAGLALAGIDAVGHGELKELGKFITVNVAEAHGSFVQSQANLLRFFQALQGLAELDVFSVPGGDGKPDLDLTGMGYIGESLGSLVGAVSCALEPAAAAVVLNVGGGGFSNFAQMYLGGPLATATGPQLLELQNLIQNIVDDFDPISFAIALRAGGYYGAPPRLAMMQNVTGDSAMEGAPAADLARALSLTYVCPCPVEVPFLPQADAPAEVSGLFYYDGAKHGFLLADDTDPEASDAARFQAAQFLRSALVEGKPLVVDPAAKDE